MGLIDEKKREATIEQIEHALAIMIRRFKKSINENHTSNITAHEYVFLSCLFKKQQETASGLAKQFEVTPSYATIVVDKLIRSGYVQRRRSTTDRRIVELTVTDKGVKTYEALSVVRRQVLQQVFGKLNDDELMQMLQLVAKLSDE
ncbi:MarR family winged helix-turn-helix transcriptional regulator [Sporolactobacillus spathodeae]|uniref:DNA-binding MarR family transcriptional regulator n=1 Tax=Sporolactobacillus spathodeae TaxID=1465502 RepID=A0ABS2Q698_9BACL|nr:MarR family transcriptional regulator [Sporolactobacillus spathodeae]MBM7656724.1 DNA-binding MarR family transcriptional regulator [Sporolactobacillus spathodeae]